MCTITLCIHRVTQIWPSALFSILSAAAWKNDRQLHKHSCFCLHILVTFKTSLDNHNCCLLDKTLLGQSPLKGNIYWGVWHFDCLFIYGIHIPCCLGSKGQTSKLVVVSCKFTSGRPGLRCMAGFEQGVWQDNHNSILCRKQVLWWNWKCLYLGHW